MADDANKTPAPSETVETKVGGTRGTSVMLAEQGGPEKPEAVRHSNTGLAVDVESGASVSAEEREDDDLDAPEGDTGAEGGEEDPEASEGEDDEAGEKEGEGDPEGDLGDYDPAKPEVVEKFDAAYFKADGNINMPRLAQEFFANQEKGAPGLNEATYAYLQDRLGVTKEYVKDIEAGQMALVTARNNALYERAGGKDRLEAAIEWGKKGGYNEAERKRFNEIRENGDPAAVNDAIDALMFRYDKAAANPAARKGKPGTRPANPTRDATSRAGSAPGVQGYASYSEWQAAFQEAGKHETKVARDAAYAEVRRRLKASPWRKQQ